MKKIFYTICILAVTCLMAGCSSNNDDTPTAPNQTTTGNEEKETYDNLRDSVGTATRPTNWTVGYTTDPTNVQIITVTSEVLPTVLEYDDMLAAFNGEECRAVATPKDEANGKTAFTLVIMGRIDEESNAPVDLELRYFSQHNKRIYTSEKLRFRPGETLGSLNTGGYKTAWK